MELRELKSIAEWEESFAPSFNTLSANQKTSPGGLLSLIPSRDSWDSFKASVQSVWGVWELAFKGKSIAFVILYDGVAFYRYESGNFWKGFSQTAGVKSIGVGEQSRINQLYQLSATRIGLSVESGEYNSAAIRQIGVPVSMWEGVLGICEWALWRAGWQELSDEGWKEAIVRRLGGRKRLIDFLVQNREAATEFIQEMLDTRELLRDDPTLTLAALKEVCRLRREYFEEVPETADFLREDDPESLFADRARLSWNENRETLSLHLPPVDESTLPARWRLGDQIQPASNVAGELVVNGAAFTRALRLDLSCESNDWSQRIPGIENWVLWDEAKSRFVPRRDLLPLALYSLISKTPLRPKLEGWASDPDDPCTDLSHELSDGTQYYVTRLVPTVRRPRLKIGDSQWFTFTQKRGVVLRLFCGTNLRTASRFSVSATGIVRAEELPRPFLEVPLSLISDDHINGEFDVFLDGHRAEGRWKTYAFKPDGTDESNAESALCFWHWDDPTLHASLPEASVHHSLQNINLGKPTDRLLAQLNPHFLHVQSRHLGRLPFGKKPQFEFHLLPRIDHIWPTSWGDYLVWILLSQVQDEASWEEVQFAYEALSYGKIQHHFVYYAIRKLERQEYLAIRGHSYMNFRNRIVLSVALGGELIARYCGLSTALYELVRAVPPISLEVAPTDAGKPPAVQLRWAIRDREAVRLACEQNRIEVVNSLW